MNREYTAEEYLNLLLNKIDSKYSPGKSGVLTELNEQLWLMGDNGAIGALKKLLPQGDRMAERAKGLIEMLKLDEKMPITSTLCQQDFSGGGNYWVVARSRVDGKVDIFVLPAEDSDKKTSIALVDYDENDDYEIDVRSKDYLPRITKVHKLGAVNRGQMDRILIARNEPGKNVLDSEKSTVCSLEEPPPPPPPPGKQLLGKK